MMKSASKSIATRLALVIAFTFSVRGQKATDNDEEIKRISNLIDQAWKKVKDVGATPPGAARSDDSPGRRYSAILWQYHSDHPHTPAGSRAVVAALNLLVAVGDSDRAAAMSEQIQPDDPAWDHVIQILWREAERKSDYAPFIEKAKAVLNAADERSIGTRVGIFLGQAYWKQNRLDLAKAAFERRGAISDGRPYRDKYRSGPSAGWRPVPQCTVTAYRPVATSANFSWPYSVFYIARCAPCEQLRCL